MNKPKRIGLYARCSTAEQNVEMQLRELRQYAELRGWQVIGEYVDEGFSGTNSNRPQLKRLLSDAHKREFDLVLVWKLDRWGRSLREIISMLQDLAEVGVEFASLKDSLDLSTSQGRLMLHIIAAFAQFEADVIKMRVNAGLANARARGQKLGRPMKRDDQAIRRLRKAGLTQNAIAAKLGISEASVRNGLAKTAKNPSKSELASA